MPENLNKEISPAKIYIAGEIQFSQNDEEELIATNTNSGISSIIDSLHSDILTALITCADISELVLRLESMGWEDTDSDTLLELVNELRQMGLILTLDQFVKTPAQDNTTSLNLKYFCWPTKNRPVELKIALSAWNAVFHEERNPPAFIIADESDLQKSEVIQVVTDFKQDYSGQLCYLPSETKACFSDLFPQNLKDYVRFAIGLENKFKRPAYGANQNFLYLLTNGQPVAVCDDDVLPQFRKSHQSNTALRLCSGFDPTQVRPITKKDDMSGFSLEASSREYLQSLEFLGKNTFSLTKNFSSVNLNKADCLDVRQYYDGTGFPAVLCHPHWGDSGMGEAAYILANRMQIEIDLDDETRYNEMMTSRMIYRYCDTFTIGGKSLMNGHIVLNPVSLLPPFSPLERNQDALWCAFLSEFSPGAKIMTSALSIRHAPLHPAEGDRIKAAQWHPGVNELLRLILGYIGTAIKPGADNISRYGSALSSFFEQNGEEITNILSDLVTQTIHGRQSLLSKNLQYYDEKPHWWAEDVYASIEFLDEYLTRDRFWIPAVYRESPESFYEYCQQFGLLLTKWPEIIVQANSFSKDFLAEYFL